MLEVMFAGGVERWEVYRDPLARALEEAGVAARLHQGAADPARVDAIICGPGAAEFDFAPYVNARAVLSLWAGVEKLLANRTLTQPLTRMVDPGMTEGMVEFVLGHVLRYHLDLELDLARQHGRWLPRSRKIARERQVTVLGLGALGRSVARALVALNFDVHGWSRTPRSLEGVTCHAGEAGLGRALAAAEILVTLLPHTPDTEGLLDARRLGWLPTGAAIINPGRGALVDEDALLAALETGHVGHATLDVFRTEPLPADHPFWAHPRVTVTPHIAAETRPVTATRVIAENLRRLVAGEPLLHLVDRGRGY